MSATLPVVGKLATAVANGTTLFPLSIRTAGAPNSSGLRVLKPASDNRKLGGKNAPKVITKGPRNFRGKPLFQVTLVERETCPSDCNRWSTCYMNSVPFGHRYKHDENLTVAIKADLEHLMTKHKDGIVVRLHVGGDFPSVAYVEFWGGMLRKFPTLAIYGYTHWRQATPIGVAVQHLVQGFSDRAAIMRSDKDNHPEDKLPGAYVVEHGVTPNPNIVVCPQQTGKTLSCMTCGFCFSGKYPVQFLQHG